MAWDVQFKKKAAKQLKGKFGDSKARIIVLARQKKQQDALAAVNTIKLIMTVKFVKLVTWMRQIIGFMCDLKDGVFCAIGAKACV